MPMNEDQLRRITVGQLAALNSSIPIQDYNPEWPQCFAREAKRIRAALGHRALAIEHIGSTAVPGLAAKPIIDILVVVSNSADEQAYAPALEAAGYVLRIREPEWHEHRMFKRQETDLNLHVFTAHSPEIDRVLLLRERLRNNAAERRLYQQTKRQLAARTWKYLQDYADAKSEVIEAILVRARAEQSTDKSGPLAATV